MNPQETVPAPVAPQVSGVLDGPGKLTKFGWNVFTKHWKTLGPIIVLPSVIIYIAQLLVTLANPIAFIVFFLLMICALVFSIASFPAAIQAVHNLTVNPQSPVTLKGQYKFGFSLFWSALLLYIIALFVSMGSMTLLFIPGMIVAVYTGMYIYTFTIDGKRGFSALVESFNLVRGRWWGVFGRMIVGVLIVFLIVVVCSAVSYILMYAFGISTTPTSGQTLSIGAWFIATIFGIAQSVISGTFGMGYIYGLYSSLKVSRQPEAPSSFKNWLIAFLCIGIVAPIVFIGIVIPVILVALSTAHTKGLDLQRNAGTMMSDIQRQMDPETLKMIQQKMASSTTSP